MRSVLGLLLFYLMNWVGDRDRHLLRRLLGQLVLAGAMFTVGAAQALGYVGGAG